MKRLQYANLIVLVLILGWSELPASEISVQADPKTNPWTSLNFNNDPEDFQFAIVSDRTGGHRPGVFEDAIRKLNLLRPEFVMSVGDLIEGYTEDEEELRRQWAQFGGFVQQLEVPFFYVPGNHDISNQVMADEWQKRFGRSYYHFVYRNVLFVCLNSEDPPSAHISARQTAHFAKVLAENKEVRWTLIFLHQPLWVYQQDTGWEHFEALLKDREYTVIAGHFHTYTKYVRHDQRYFILATTGGVSTLRGPAFGQFDHVVWVTMTDQGPQVANLLLEGIWDQDVRTEEAAALADRLLMADPIGFDPILIGQALFEGTTIQLRVTNETDVPMRIQGAFVPNAYLRPRPNTLDIMLGPNSLERKALQLQVDLPVNVSDLSPLVLDWSITYELPDRPPLELEGTQRFIIERVFECPHRTMSVVVDGQLDEWEQLSFVCREPAQIRMDAETWQGPDDSSFRFAAEYDENYLYIAVDTIDEHLVLHPKKEPWQQDGIEVRVDARPDPERSTGRGQGEFSEILLVALSPGETQDQMVYYNREKVPEGVQAICVKTATGHATEIAIPAAYLDEKQGRTWEAFRLNIAVDDYDEATGSGASIWWRPDWRYPLTYPGSGTFTRH